jgi:hypothetical protein
VPITDTGGRNVDIVWAKIHAGLYVVARGNEKLGTVRGDYFCGFSAHLNGGERLQGRFDLPQQAVEAPTRIRANG